MTIDEAAKVLGVAPDVAPDQLEAHFNELRVRLEDKLAKAPTPGLKDKYRRALEDTTQAFETLFVAMDASTLPVLQRSEPQPPSPAETGDVRSAKPPMSAPDATVRPATARKKSGGLEFLLVAVVAVAVLAGGGWFVLKLRAEKAAAAAEATRQAAEAAAEALRLKQEEEARAAELARKASHLRTELAAARVTWEALENRLREAERRTSDAKGELRGFRDGPAWKKAEISAIAHRYELYTTWLNSYLVSHPFKFARARAEQLLSDRLVDEAAEAIEEMNTALAELVEYVGYRAEGMLDGTTEVIIESIPTGLKFVFTDSYGRTTEGVTPARLTGQPLSHLHDPKYDGYEGDTDLKLGEFTVEPTVRFMRPGWKDIVEPGRTSFRNHYFSGKFVEGSLQVSSQPAGVPFIATNDFGWKATGKSPATLSVVPPGRVRVTLSRTGFQDVWQDVEVEAGKLAKTTSLDQRSQTVRITVAEPKSKIFLNRQFVGYEQAALTDLAPGEHALQLEAEGFAPYRTKLTVKQEPTQQTHAYSFKQLAVENITCSECKGAGQFPRSERCGDCRGTRIRPHAYCDGRGWVGGMNGYPRITCPGGCNGGGREACTRCQNGRVHWTDYCTRCGGDGRLSPLQLSG
jgi:hypothetical protein